MQKREDPVLKDLNPKHLEEVHLEIQGSKALCAAEERAGSG